VGQLYMFRYARFYIKHKTEAVRCALHLL